MGWSELRFTFICHQQDHFNVKKMRFSNWSLGLDPEERITFCFLISFCISKIFSGAYSKKRGFNSTSEYAGVIYIVVKELGQLSIGSNPTWVFSAEDPGGWRNCV